MSARKYNEMLAAMFNVRRARECLGCLSSAVGRCISDRDPSKVEWALFSYKIASKEVDDFALFHSELGEGERKPTKRTHS